MWFMDKTQVLHKPKDPLQIPRTQRKARSQASVIPGLPENSQKPGGQLVWSLQWKHNKNNNKMFQTKQDGRQENTQGCPLTSTCVLWCMWTHTDIHEHTHHAHTRAHTHVHTRTHANTHAHQTNEHCRERGIFSVWVEEGKAMCLSQTSGKTGLAMVAGRTGHVWLGRWGQPLPPGPEHNRARYRNQESSATVPQRQNPQVGLQKGIPTDLSRET